MSESGCAVLRGTAAVELKRPAKRNTAKPGGRRERQDSPTASIRSFVGTEGKRGGPSPRRGVPAYVVFPDRTLIEMAALKPTSLDEMAAVSGVGARKLERYGPTFLKILRG